MKMRNISIGLLVFGLLFTACAKYDEGPAFSLYSRGKRVEGAWFFSHVAYNEVDSSEHYQNGRIKFYLGEDGENNWGLFTWEKGYDPVLGATPLLQVGSWKFIAEQDSFQMVMLQEKVEDYDTIHWKINRLAYDEWWMERYLDDTTRLEWKFWKWVY